MAARQKLRFLTLGFDAVDSVEKGFVAGLFCFKSMNTRAPLPVNILWSRFAFIWVIARCL